MTSSRLTRMRNSGIVISKYVGAAFSWVALALTFLHVLVACALWLLPMWFRLQIAFFFRPFEKHETKQKGRRIPCLSYLRLRSLCLCLSEVISFS